VEKAGGTVATRFYTKWAIRRIMQGKTDPINSIRSEQILPQQEEEDEDGEYEDEEDEEEDYESKANTIQTTHPLPAQTPALPNLYQHRLPDPTSRKDVEYYRDPAHRGYLAHTVAEGQTPSLCFKVPNAPNKLAAARKKQGTNVGENRIW
jgi:large subunit ribosomal protein L15